MGNDIETKHIEKIIEYSENSDYKLDPMVMDLVDIARAYLDQQRAMPPQEKIREALEDFLYFGIPYDDMSASELLPEKSVETILTVLENALQEGK